MNRPDNKKTILVLGKLPPPFMGPAIATEIILNSTLREDFQLLHFNTTINRTIRTQGKKSLKKVFISFGKYLAYLALLARQRPDLVLVPFAQETVGFFKDIPYLLFPRMFGIKVLGQLRGGNFKNWMATASKPVRFSVKQTLKNTNGVIVLGNNLIHLFEGIFPKERIYVVPNGADYTFSGNARSSSSDKVSLLFLANLQPTKGIEDVISSLTHLTDNELQKVNLNVGGGWRNHETEKTCTTTVKENRLPVKFLGILNGEKKFRFLSGADVFIFPPRAQEGHPWVIIEAMAAGLPIISTDRGAIIESVIDGENGFIVESNRPDQIAEKIRWFIKNPQEREKMGQKSRELYLKNFTENSMVERLKHVFTLVLQN